jgi:hypothetical protein
MPASITLRGKRCIEKEFPPPQQQLAIGNSYKFCHKVIQMIAAD